MKKFSDGYTNKTKKYASSMVLENLLYDTIDDTIKKNETCKGEIYGKEELVSKLVEFINYRKNLVGICEIKKNLK